MASLAVWGEKMDVKISVDTTEEARIFDTIFSAGTINMPNYLKEWYELHPEFSREIHITYTIGSKTEKGERK